jgi:predicted RNA-binding Zn-ribbon protein involved in translation (DUF1610 family)
MARLLAWIGKKNICPSCRVALEKKPWGWRCPTCGLETK